MTAARPGGTAADLTRATTVVDRETIEQQSAISRDIGDILGKTVPGFGISTEGSTNFTQNLRGRNFLVLVDGVPISTPLRDSARDLKIIDPSAIERIEVIRGGTAAFGFGATGGLVNYITRDPGREALSSFAEAGMRFSTEHPDGSLQGHASLGVSGQRGGVDFILNGSFAQRNGFFDADGDRIPPDPLGGQGGLADSDERNVLGKLGYDFDQGRQRLEVMVNSYDIEQDTDFVTSAGDFGEREKATAVPGEPLGNQGRTENELVNLTYTNRDIGGSSVDLQGYYQDYLATFPIDPDFLAGSTNEAEKTGARLTIDTPVLGDPAGPRVQWGVDYLNSETNEIIVGDNPFGTASVPFVEQDAVAGFAQLELPVGSIGTITSGVRHEEIQLDVPTFSGPGGTVQGGELDYSETLFNARGVAFITENIDLFGGFSQGFTVTEAIGELQSAASAWAGGGGSAEDLDPEAQKVDHYELGLRGSWDRIEGSLVGFYSESDLGTTFEGFAQPVREPEEIFGVELSLEAELNPQWSAGGTVTWADSNTDADGDGDLDEELPTRRVPPVKITGFAEYSPYGWWRNRLQLLYSGDREPDGATNFAGTPDEVDSFVIFDYHAGFDIGPGELQLGVENLLNEDYFPVAAQSFGTDSAFAQGQGRTVSLSYRAEW
ncbi:TonB-dependent receptor [Spiribacter halobius]|uniref:TonB-dependent receptor n=1 Tax=Sediminicurvatus halobius TaxID=2182432 RepID=UPI0011B21B03|nr:TonB-dependent receptor [Spiribacter halobius]UEX77743.1 TonB-dependent receptor [Spiribacter halobius]